MKKESKVISLKIIVNLILFTILIYSGSKIYDWHKENVQNKEIAKNINNTAVIKNENSNENKNKYNVNFKLLKNQNNDTVAWIKVNGTNIEYPIVKSENNEFYLNHSLDKTNNSAGWIFADYKNKFDGTDKNIVIYGHNRKDKSMFGTLKNILNPKWYNNPENEEIIFIQKNENFIYKVFSVYEIEKESYYIKTDFSSNNEFKEFVETLKKRSIKNFETEVSETDSILTLSTCSSNNEYRVVLHAKKL